MKILLSYPVFRSFDLDNDSALSMEEWLKGLSVYLKGTFEEKINFCFNVYDMNSDGVITREEMFQFLKTSIMKTNVEEEPDENTKVGRKVSNYSYINI